MSLSAEIRAVLRKAPGPMWPSEVREELGDEYTATQVCGILNSMAKLGEAQRLERDGKQGYLLDPNYKPKRPQADAPAKAPPQRKKKAPVTKAAVRRPRLAARPHARAHGAASRPDAGQPQNRRARRH